MFYRVYIFMNNGTCRFESYGDFETANRVAKQKMMYASVHTCRIDDQAGKTLKTFRKT